MILLCEGVNLVGKTALTSLLLEALPQFSLLKMGIPSKEAYPYFRNALSEAFEKNQNLIIDRFHLSNSAYGDILGGKVMDGNEWLKIDMTLKEMGAWIFLLMDDPFIIEQRLQEGGDRKDGAHLLKRYEIAQIQNRFVQHLYSSSIEHKWMFTLKNFINNGELTPQFYWVVNQINQHLKIENFQNKSLERLFSNG